MISCHLPRTVVETVDEEYATEIADVGGDSLLLVERLEGDE